MTYTKHTIVVLSLLLSLQAGKCKHAKGTALISTSKACAKETDNTIKKNYFSIAEFEPQLNHSTDGMDDMDNDPYNYKPNNNASYNYSGQYDKESDDESGYGSDQESNSRSTQTISPAPTSKGIDAGFSFKKEIEAMRNKADKRRNITWHLAGDKLERIVEKNCNSLYALEDYFVIALNIYRAAEKICLLYGKNMPAIAKDARRLLSCYNKFVPYHDYQKNAKEKEENDWIKAIKKINFEVVAFLKKHVFPTVSLEAINKKLRLAENYVGLEDTHYDVTTTFHIKDQTFALEDKKNFPLTEKQKEKIRNRASEHWFNRLEEFEKMLFNSYVDKFLDDQHYIPTQLRDIIGCRNAYRKNVWRYDQNNQKTLLGHYYHSGSLASPNPRKDDASIKADLEITQQNWEQVQQVARDIVWLSLNRNMGGQDIPLLKKLSEKKIVEDTLQTVGYNQFMNFSINEVSTTPIFKHLVDKLPSHLPASDKNLDQNKAVEDQKRKKYGTALTRLQEAAKQLNVTNLWKQNTNTSDNYFANLAANYALSEILLGEPVGISCKSGKDRTGMMSSWIDSKIIRAHYPSLDEKRSPVYESLAYTGHYQLLASINGGMPGRFGMKPVKKNAEAYSFSKPLFCKPATLTDIKLDTNQEGQEEGMEKSDKALFLPNLHAVEAA
ncbi:MULTISPECIES: inositol phosphate phosphatase SopB [Candidatus Cardinium]|uniref:inositol phosphate phosphatase SopB n=1 Tax=Candidatus Cardinium TaxID=273135 RepID=UPI001FA960F7|nr:MULTISPECIES: inositol phosphate phosphatase SopB [Cardinium]